MGEVQAHNIFYGASTSEVASHGMGVVVPITYSTEPALLLLAPLWAMLGPITYFTELALLRLTGTVMGEVGSNHTYHGASITVVGWHGNVRGRVP